MNEPSNWEKFCFNLTSSGGFSLRFFFPCDPREYLRAAKPRVKFSSTPRKSPRGFATSGFATTENRSTHAQNHASYAGKCGSHDNTPFAIINEYESTCSAKYGRIIQLACNSSYIQTNCLYKRLKRAWNDLMNILANEEMENMPVGSWMYFRVIFTSGVLSSNTPMSTYVRRSGVFTHHGVKWSPEVKAKVRIRKLKLLKEIEKLFLRAPKVIKGHLRRKIVGKEVRRMYHIRRPR